MRAARPRLLAAAAGGVASLDVLVKDGLTKPQQEKVIKQAAGSGAWRVGWRSSLIWPPQAPGARCLLQLGPALCLDERLA